MLRQCGMIRPRFNMPPGDMASIDPQRLALAAYPYVRTLATRVSDMDGHGHLNAIRVGHFYEDARAAFYGVAFKDLPRIRTVVAQLNIRYLREGHWPGDLVVATGISRVGGAAFEMAQALFQDGVCIGLCDTVLVNTLKGASAPLPAANRAGLERMSLREAVSADPT
jgi:acyl-CoA thioester hydrolase